VIIKGINHLTLCGWVR